MDRRYLNELRRFEMNKLSSLIPPGSRVLEFGAGTGEQARYLADHGFDVVAVDLSTSRYAADRVFPIQEYDGRKLPIDAHSVDVIFSSNVLEHVTNLEEIFSEFRRVLRPGGFGVHAVPTPAWRLWTFVAGPPASAKAVARMVMSVKQFPNAPAQWLKQHVRSVVVPLIPIAHGRSGEGISQLWTYSRQAWCRRFKRFGWSVLKDRPIGLFYSGQATLGLNLPFKYRELLSGSLGSGTRVFVIRPEETL